MANEPANSHLYANADVYIAAVGSTIPATVATAFNGSWTLAGLLDGDDGFEFTRDEDVSDKFGWGGILIRTARKNFKQTVKFSVYEDNAVTHSLIWPGSSAGTIVVPVPGFIMIAFEARDGGGQVHRLISKYRAQVDVDGSFTLGESDLTKYPLTATIFPNSAGELFTEQSAPTVASIALTPLTLALTTGLNKFVQAVATFTDATTANVSDRALWTSSDPTKATVVPSTAGGVVSWVAAGTSSISCTYGGITSTAPSVATCS